MLHNKLIVFFLVLKIINFTKSQENNCNDLETCAKCIQQLGCMWCSEPIEKGQNKCQLDTNDENSTLTWCPYEKLMRPKSDAKTVKNDTFNDGKTGDAVQLRPQKVNLTLRRGESYDLRFQYSRAANYPVDLYYLMDMSDSMTKHKKAVANLGKKLVDVMLNITTDFRLGFGSFVDKTAAPFVDIRRMQMNRTCDRKLCVNAYSFKNHLNLTSDHELFSKEVKSAIPSRNVDHPEGGFDAMMQAIVCKKIIGWRDAARHILIFSTDAESHIAGDGRLGGVYWPNDGKCRVVNNQYTSGLEYDYPSVSFLNHIAKENNVNVMFTVPNKIQRVFKSYENMVKQKAFENANVAILNEKSSNIVDLIVDNYKKIADSVLMTSNASKSIDITYNSTCGRESCIKIPVGKTIDFIATIKPTECKSEIFHIKPEGVAESILIDLKVICQCDCESPDHPGFIKSSPNCSQQGSEVCGICQCDPGYFGNNCECDKEKIIDTDIMVCQKDENSTVCSNNGICKCGTCICEKHTSGKYCECNNNSCKRRKGLLCSGEDHGKCSCGKCECLEGWKGDDCGCVDNNNLCTSPSGNGLVCSGHGICECGQCVCQNDENNYYGKYCEECASCEGQRCKDLRPCVECQIFGTGPHNRKECKTKCTEFNTTIVNKIREDNSNPDVKICSVFDDVNCTIIFQYQYTDNQLIVEAQLEKRCYAPLDLFVIGLSILGSVILIGLITLIIWKIVTSIHDKIEYEKFEKERMESKWHHGNNPLYVEASSTFHNPTYRVM